MGTRINYSKQNKTKKKHLETTNITLSMQKSGYACKLASQKCIYMISTELLSAAHFALIVYVVLRSYLHKITHIKYSFSASELISHNKLLMFIYWTISNAITVWPLATQRHLKFIKHILHVQKKRRITNSCLQHSESF